MIYHFSIFNLNTEDGNKFCSLIGLSKEMVSNTAMLIGITVYVEFLWYLLIPLRERLSRRQIFQNNQPKTPLSGLGLTLPNRVILAFTTEVCKCVQKYTPYIIVKPKHC